MKDDSEENGDGPEQGERDQVIEYFSPSNLLNFIAADPGTDQTGKNYVDQCKIDYTEKNPVLNLGFT